MVNSMAYSPHHAHCSSHTNLKLIWQCTKKYRFIAPQAETSFDEFSISSDVMRMPKRQTDKRMSCIRKIPMTSQTATKIFILCASLISFTKVHAADSVQNASTASAHASKAVTLGIAASGQTALGIMAVPLLSAGIVSNGMGGASTAAGKSSAATAGSSTSGPLPITDETITITSPTEALKQRTSITPR